MSCVYAVLVSRVAKRYTVICAVSSNFQQRLKMPSSWLSHIKYHAGCHREISLSEKVKRVKYAPKTRDASIPHAYMVLAFVFGFIQIN